MMDQKLTLTRWMAEAGQAEVERRRVERVVRGLQWAVRRIYNVCCDLRYGGILGGRIETRYAAMGAYETTNSDYTTLDLLFENRIREGDVFVDVGCGKGRVINWWLSRGHRGQIIGIDLDEEIAAKTRKRLKRWKNVTVLAGDAVCLIPGEGTIFYLYNPFSAEVLKRFLNRFSEIFQGRTDVLIVYNRCDHIGVVRNDPRWVVESEERNLVGESVAFIRMRGASAAT